MSQGTDLLAQPRKDPLDQCPFYKPLRTLPDAYLPLWFRRPLDSKIPAKSNPEDPLVFTRPKLGKTLFYNFPKKDFDTSPKIDVPLEYNSLHDPNLYRYFHVIQRNYLKLVKIGQLMPFHDGVVCTLEQFNQFREYVRSIIVLKEKTRRVIDERILANEMAAYQHLKDKQLEDKPYEYAKKKLKSRNRRLHFEWDRKKPSPKKPGEKTSGKKDEYQERFMKKKEFIREEGAIIREMHQTEAIREFRHVTYAWRRFLINREKHKPMVERWDKLVQFQEAQKAKLDEARRRYEDNYLQRVQHHKQKHEDMWAKYKSLKRPLKQKQPEVIPTIEDLHQKYDEYREADSTEE